MSTVGNGSAPWPASCLSFSDVRNGLLCRKRPFTTHADRRHLWPAFYRLISECRPAVVFGEQVANTDGREWFSAVRTDLERGGYACGCADLAAASVGAPHIRQRLFWLGDSEHDGSPAFVEPGSEEEEGRMLEPKGPDWNDCKLVPCTDGKTRVTQSGLRPLAHGVPNRVGRLRAYGNAIVPQVAAEFISAFMDCKL